jgi:hypothetical protein
MMAREQRRARLDELRRAARHFCYTNKGLLKYGMCNTVTSDDIRADKGIVPISRHDWRHTYEHNILGVVFREGFERVGYYQSKAEGSHGRVIGIWRMKESRP